MVSTTYCCHCMPKMVECQQRKPSVPTSPPANKTGAVNYPLRLCVFASESDLGHAAPVMSEPRIIRMGSDRIGWRGRAYRQTAPEMGCIAVVSVLRNRRGQLPSVFLCALCGSIPSPLHPCNPWFRQNRPGHGHFCRDCRQNPPNRQYHANHQPTCGSIYKSSRNGGYHA